MFENPRKGRQARNFTTNVPKIPYLKFVFRTDISRKLTLGASDSEGRRSAFIYHTFIIHTHNLLHYYKAGDQASSVELLEDLRFILSCREY